MLEISQVEKDFYLEIKESINYYLEHFEKRLSNPEQDKNLFDNTENVAYELLNKKTLSKEEVGAIKRIIKEISFGVTHSLFCSIDGATALASDGKALDLIDFKTQKPLTEGALHENFFTIALDDK